MRFYPIFLCLLVMAACYNEPEFPVEPDIEFRSVQFVDNTDPRFPDDTLKVTVSFRDGDGDLGIIPPGQHFYDSVFDINGQRRYIRYGEFDTLPAHNCSNYRTGYFDPNGRFVPSVLRQEVTDTIYIRPNSLYYNFFLDIYRIVNGQEERFDFIESSYPRCGVTPNGRFRLNNADDNKPLSGTVTYNFTSQFLLPFFSDDSLIVRVRIADRAGNMSNQVESQVFTLRGIQVNR
ncbi:hypothetical protein [Cesiribacter sp. SM1]|uniref:hypothetical protein n=1 Tax=Cesiribacter sp. SM1 TaxID=2861196 RepID=UPI001CD5621D|nr:hypothetical protein [Cesiribacter sp. SM1]